MTDNRESAIAILVSFYGDSPYVKDFLDSLDSQSFRNFRLFCRFDGSVSPSVRSLVSQYGFAEASGDEQHLGIPDTYWRLMHDAAGYSYVMFADQDDLWHPDKVRKSLLEIQAMEMQHGCEMPILVHSDLTVVNAEGKTISPSFFRYQSMNPRRNALKELMIQNNVTGCTVIINRALADLVQNAPAAAICHDWYLAMAAAAFGKIGFISEPLADYRQHPRNHFGAVPVRKLVLQMFRREKWHARLVLTQKQARSFMEKFNSRLNPGQIAILDAWGKKMPELSYLKRLGLVFRFHFRKNDWLRTLGMWWSL